jgi:hypothetical protein
MGQVDLESILDPDDMLPLILVEPEAEDVPPLLISQRSPV